MLIRRHPLDILKLIPKRKVKSHKGTYGRLLIIAGSNIYTGAAALTVEAALRSGVGMVYVITVPAAAHVIQMRSPEAIVIKVPEKSGVISSEALGTITEIVKSYKIDALCIGPGMGADSEVSILCENLMGMLKTNAIPSLIDADALFPTMRYLKTNGGNSNQFVLTPHPKEYQEMCEFKSMDVSKKDILKVSKDIQQSIVYKTHQSLVVHKDEIWVSDMGNVGLATAGSGDVLSGLISGFMAQGLAPFSAAKLGTYMHGLTAELVSKDFGLRGMLARNLCEYIPNTFQEMIQDYGAY